jgi:oligopeptide transport system substrate-binding protein
MRLRSRAFIGIAAAALALSACGGPSASSSSSSSAETTFRRGVGANPDSVDPHKAQGTWENDVIGDMFIGLFTENAKSQPIPGIAESWKVSDDQLTWTFKLRQTNWSDGTPLTAKDFEYSLRRLLDPATLGAVYASVQYPIKNAQAVNGGELPLDQVGVKALDDYTLEVKLEYPAPYLPGLLKHYTAFPVPKHVIEQHGDQWTRPENIVVNGAFKLAEWRSGNFLRLVKNESFEDAANVCFNEVIFYTQPDHDAMVRRAQAGEIDMNNSFPTGQLEQVEKKLPGWPRVAPMMATTYLAANTTEAPFDDARVRKALALAIDREHITGNILKGGEIPAYSFVPESINGYPETGRFTWAGEPLEMRRADAKALLEQAGYGPDNPLTFEYIYRSTGNNPRIAPVLQENWTRIADWVRPEIRQVETKDLYKQMQQKDFTLSDAGWVADYNDAYNFLYLLDSRTGPMNYGGYSNPAYDKLIDASNTELDPAKRAELLRQAEQTMLDDTGVIPVLVRVTQDIVSPTITGYEDNPEDIHRSRYMCKKTGG